MASFFDGLKKMAQGKPVFDGDESASQQSTAASSASEPDTQTPTSQPKILPQIIIERFKYSESGDRIDYFFTFQNSSTVAVELDKILIFDTHREINNYLRPGEKREYKTYSGSRHTIAPNTQCELTFKDPSGDYFKTVHYIESQKDGDGIYRIKHVKFIPPVRDV